MSATKTVDSNLFFEGLAAMFAEPDLHSSMDEWGARAKLRLGAMMKDQKSPNGVPYAALAPATIRRKGHDVILFETGALFESVNSNGSGAILETTPTTCSVGSNHQKNGVDVAARLHYGDSSRNLPARPFIGLNDQMIVDAVELIADDVISQIAAIG